MTEQQRYGYWQRVRTSFLTGLVVVAPIGLTIWLVWSIVTFIDGQVMLLLPERLQKLLDFDVPGIGTVIFVAFTIIAGYFARNLLGRQIIRLGENIVERMPVIRSIYNALKQIVETIFTQSKASFQKVCLVEYPRRGIWAIAFISTETRGEIIDKVETPEMVSVFLPTTPNPTSGFLLFVPTVDVVVLDMTIEEAAKLVISAGLVVPQPKNGTAETPRGGVRQARPEAPAGIAPPERTPALKTADAPEKTPTGSDAV